MFRGHLRRPYSWL